MASAWIYQDDHMVQKHGADAASWYVGWCEPDGRRRCKSFGPGYLGKKRAEREKHRLEEALMTGTYEMKTMKQWGEVARSQSAYLHIGRVNSARRIALCAAYGAQSFDGSSASRYAKTMPLLENARRQMPLALYGHRSVPVNLGET